MCSVYQHTNLVAQQNKGLKPGSLNECFSRLPCTLRCFICIIYTHICAYIYVHLYINTLSVEALLSHHIRLPFATSNIPGHMYNWRVIDDCVSHGEGRISPATPMNQNNDQPSRRYCGEELRSNPSAHGRGQVANGVLQGNVTTPELAATSGIALRRANAVYGL